MLAKLQFPEMKFDLYFLGYEALEDIPEDAKDRVSTQRACLGQRGAERGRGAEGQG